MNWKEVSEFPNYQVSETGLVRNKEGKVLKTFVQNGGYEVASFPQGTKSSAKRTVHRLVATAFIPNPEGLPEVNHKDGNKLNNPSDNLEWCGRRQNCQHAKETGLWAYNHPTLGKKLPKRGQGRATEYFGICWVEKQQRWAVRTQHLGVVLWQKQFKSEVDAAMFHDEQVRKHGINRPINFPVD